MTDKILEAVKALGGDIRNTAMYRGEIDGHLTVGAHIGYTVFEDIRLCEAVICTVSEFNTYAEQWLKEAYMHNAALDLDWDIDNSYENHVNDDEDIYLFFSDDVWVLGSNKNCHSDDDFYICTKQEFIDYCNANKPCKEVKPVFTQEMADAGELPPVGCRFKVRNTEFTCIGYRSSGSVVGECDHELILRSYHPHQCQPIQSPRDKAIDAMESQLKAHHWSQEEVCIAIYDWLKQLTPEQRKEFDL